MRRAASTAATFAHRRLITSTTGPQRRAAAEIGRASELTTRCAVPNTARSAATTANSVRSFAARPTNPQLSFREQLLGQQGMDWAKKVRRAFWIGGAVLVTGYMFNPLRKIGPGQVGVTHLFGKVSDTTLSPGLHLINPFRHVVRFSTRTQRENFVASVPTREGLMVELRSTLLFRIDPASAVGIYSTLSEAYVARVVQPTYQAAIRDVCSGYEAKVLYDQASYHKMEAEVKEHLARQLGPRGIIIEDAPLTAVTLPAQLTEAIQKKLQMEQEAQRMEFVLKRENLEAERKAIEAKGIQAFQKIVADGVSPQLLRWKGIEATEKLAQSTNTKVIVIGGSGDGLPIILNSQD